MRTDQIYSSLLFSLCLHSLFVIAAVVYVLYSGARHEIVTFDVSLVDSSSGSPSSPPAQKTVEVSPPHEEKKTHMTEKPEKVTPKEKSVANERIAALEAKKKIETMQRLRKSIDISAAKGIPNSKVQTMAGNSGYISLIGAKIREQFRIPESMDRDLLAIISIRIARNGTITILSFEKKSDNPLFDRAAIKAINDASPVPPPPSEMEIFMRLRP